MKIEVVNHNLVYLQEHPSVKAWKYSRPKDTDSKLDDILNLDLPVNEMFVFNLQIESTILEREIIASMKLPMWARSSRVYNVLNFVVDSEIYNRWSNTFENSRTAMLAVSSDGERQDEYRRFLPMFSLTEYTLQISMRDLIRLFLYFNFLQFNVDYLHDFFERACDRILSVLTNFSLVTSDNIKRYKFKNLLPANTNEWESYSVSDYLVICSKLPMSLRAQLIRHRALNVRDNLFELLSNPNFIGSDLTTEVNVEVSGHVDDFKDVLMKRSCWAAQYNLWSPFLNQIEEMIGGGLDNLPCHAGACPYSKDVELRYTDKDPNAPCPIHASINKRSLSTNQLIEIRNQYEQDKRPKFWIDEIDAFKNGG